MYLVQSLIFIHHSNFKVHASRQQLQLVSWQSFSGSILVCLASSRGYLLLLFPGLFALFYVVFDLIELAFFQRDSTIDSCHTDYADKAVEPD